MEEIDLEHGDKNVFIPSREEIKAAALAIQQTWSETERRRRLGVRRGVTIGDEVEIVEYSVREILR